MAWSSGEEPYKEERAAVSRRWSSAWHMSALPVLEVLESLVKMAWVVVVVRLMDGKRSNELVQKTDHEGEH
jgi:hypothetical protein